MPVQKQSQLNTVTTPHTMFVTVGIWGNRTCTFKFESNDTLLFGRESAGVPDHVHNSIKYRLKIPMMDNKRSLNIASSVAIILSENLRQTNFNK